MKSTSKRYKKLKVLGSGSFGVVWLAKNKQTNENCILKVVRVKGNRSEQAIQRTLNDAEIEQKAFKQLYPSTPNERFYSNKN